MQKHRKDFRRFADSPKTFVRPEFLDVGDRPVETNFRFWIEHVIHWHALLFAVVLMIWIGARTFGF